MSVPPPVITAILPAKSFIGRPPVAPACIGEGGGERHIRCSQVTGGSFSGQASP